MNYPVTLTTDRLRLRSWREQDLLAFAAINADPSVMRYFPSTLTREESDAVARRIISHFDAHGYGFWAVELLDGSDFMGFIGLNNCQPPLPFAPAVEIGWRLATEHQARGYATEGARAALLYGFDTLQLDQIVAYTIPANGPSRNVMQKLGMHHDPVDDFGHHRVPADHPFHMHVLYRIRRHA